MDAPRPARYDNARFFGDHARSGGPASIPESVFYAGERPPPDVSLATRTALTPLRFSLVVFLVGWAGILFQASFLHQVVFGAPVFEELAKVGLALVVAHALRLRSFGVRLVLAWASGAAFGILEHLTTYSDEEAWLYAGRVVFHAGTAGLSMAFYQAFERMEDVRARWATTVVPTLLHWANNFAAVVLAVASLALPVADVVSLAWATLVTACVLVLTAVALASPERFRATSRDLLRRFVPSLVRDPATTETTPPPQGRETEASDPVPSDDDRRGPLP